MTDIPSGERFSLLYLDRSRPLQDSKRARRRLAAQIAAHMELGNLPSVVEKEIGVRMNWGPGGIIWTDTLEAWELRDVLDLVTLAFREIAKGRVDRSKD